MSGICGIVASDPAGRIAPSELAEMLRALDVNEIGGGASALLGAAGMGSLGFRREPAGVASDEAPEGRVLLAFHGAFFGEDAPGDLRDGAGTARALLARYVRDGIGFVERLAGDFALAVWDGRRRRAYLAVDRFRVKPLFYAATPERLVFGSRMAAVVAAPGIPQLHLGPECVLDVVSSSMIPTPRTIYREVRKLAPGSVLEYAGGGETVRAYWDFSFLEPRREGFRALARETQRLMQAAIRDRLAADGGAERVGAFLSGGVDSSTVVGELHRLTGGPVRTFSIGFGEERFNEIEYARIVARKFGADHHEYFVTPKDTVAVLDVLARNFDEPYANSSSVPVYYCAKLAADHGIEALYAGDAGDELFAGNPWYATQKFFEYWSRVPSWPRERLLRPAVEGAGRALPVGPFAKARKYVQRASIPLPERLTSYGFFNVIPPDALFEPGFLAEAAKDYDPDAALFSLYRAAPARDELDRRLYIDLKLVISDNDVLKVVRMTNAAGLAVRFPFMDHRFAELAASVPAPLKMRGLKLRSFFKKAYADLLPREVIVKKKHGFGLPIPVWLRTDPELREIMMELVLGSRTLSRGIYRRETLETLVERHRTDPTSFYGTALWHLMMIEMWLRRHGDAARSRAADGAR